MNHNNPWRLAALACVLALNLGTAHAADRITDETRVDLRTRTGVETLIVADLKAGETRAATTAAGHPALVTRTADGLKIEIASETFNVRLPDTQGNLDDLAALGPDAKVIKIDTNEERRVGANSDGEGKKVVVIKHHGPVSDHDIDAIAAHSEGQVPPLADGQNVRVMRMIRHESTETTPGNH